MPAQRLVERLPWSELSPGPGSNLRPSLYKKGDGGPADLVQCAEQEERPPAGPAGAVAYRQFGSARQWFWQCREDRGESPKLSGEPHTPEMLWVEPSPPSPLETTSA